MAFYFLSELYLAVTLCSLGFRSTAFCLSANVSDDLKSQLTSAITPINSEKVKVKFQDVKGVSNLFLCRWIYNLNPQCPVFLFILGSVTRRRKNFKTSSTSSRIRIDVLRWAPVFRRECFSLANLASVRRCSPRLSLERRAFPSSNSLALNLTSCLLALALRKSDSFSVRFAVNFRSVL